MNLSEANKWASAVARRILHRQPSMSWNAAQIYFYQFLAILLGLVSNIIIARLLGPKEKGVYDLYVLLSNFISEIGTLGFGYGLLYYLLSQCRAIAEVHGTGLVFSAVMGLVTAAIGFSGLAILRSSFQGLPDWIILLCFFSSPFLYYRIIWGNLLLGIDKSVTIYRNSFLLSAIILAGVLVLWQVERVSASTVVVLNMLATLAITIVGATVLLSDLRKTTFNFALAKDSLKYGWIFFIGHLANVLHFRIDQIMVNHWLGTEKVGVYAVSLHWAEMLFVLDTGIIAATFYKAGSAAGAESYDMSLRHAKLMLAIMSSVGLLLAISSYPLVYFLYGEAYLDATLPLVILIPGIAFWSSGKILSRYLFYNQGKMWLTTGCSVVGLCINVLLNLMLIPKYGLIGASTASSISYITVIILIFWIYQQARPSGNE